VLTPLTFLGGTLYSINTLPPAWQTVTLFKPRGPPDERLLLEAVIMHPSKTGGRFRLDTARRTLAPDDDAAAREAHAQRARLRLRLALAVLLCAAALLAVGSWTYLSVERSLRGLRAAALKSVLDAQAKGLEVWIENQKLHVRRLAVISR
jgi:cytochrome c-type biogenesis protein CcmH/NrfG